MVSYSIVVHDRRYLCQNIRGTGTMDRGFPLGWERRGSGVGLVPTTSDAAAFWQIGMAK